MKNRTALLGFFALLVFPDAAVAAWGYEVWGTMVWGQAGSGPSVPGVQGFGLIALALGLSATAAWRLRRRGTALGLPVLLVLIAIPLVVVAGTVSVPNTFVNGEIADADEVNENFDAVETAVNDNDSLITALETDTATALSTADTALTDAAAAQAEADAAVLDAATALSTANAAATDALAAQVTADTATTVNTTQSTDITELQAQVIALQTAVDCISGAVMCEEPLYQYASVGACVAPTAPAQCSFPSTSYSIEQALGEPTYSFGGCFCSMPCPFNWSAGEPDMELHELVFTFTSPVKATQLNVWETANPVSATGFIQSVAVTNFDTGVESTVWSGVDDTTCGELFTAEFPGTILTNTVRVRTRTSVAAYEHIDAVQLVGCPPSPSCAGF